MYAPRRWPLREPPRAPPLFPGRNERTPGRLPLGRDEVGREF